MERCQQAAMLLPKPLREQILALDGEAQMQTEEIRLRTGHPLALTLTNGALFLSGQIVEQQHLEQVVDLVTGYSRYTAAESMRYGFFTARGGFRVGLCGSMVMEQGEIRTVAELSSLSIRIPRERKGIAEAMLRELFGEKGIAESFLVISPPGAGKTTFLRDAVRLLSDQYHRRVALVDERGEIAAAWRGAAQLEVGRQTDVISGCPKDQALNLLLRAMNPQIIVVDEVVGELDMEGIIRAANSGVLLVASVHAQDMEELRRKRVYAAMLAAGIFQKAVVISKQGSRRIYRMERLQ